MRKGALLAAACALLSFPAIASAVVTPTEGFYEGALTHNANIVVHFQYSTFSSPRVHWFAVGVVEGNTTRYKNSFEWTFVRNAEFWWEGHNRHRQFIQVTGYWTAPHTVVGTIQINDGGVKEYHAHLLIPPR